MAAASLPDRLASAVVTARLAQNFLRSLENLSRRSSETTTRRTRYRKIKLAAYASMASAVGADHVWSRALLWKIRSRASLHRLPTKSHGKLRGRRRSRSEAGDDDDEAEELRKIVPGGDAMDMGLLLEETAHYIQCLASQVEIMRNIADSFSSSSSSS
ncbi:hypothetical protein DM860_012529 [Cuscuta australis]|uniref:IBH1-like N-terminal domain-containing protein n=1 Tax=Cuscuta australis TaxID=267555 RepID=A0A328DFQ8_9ASTE|nr:hypothetical protein DM860_012529 [Cuscuta australis]